MDALLVALRSLAIDVTDLLHLGIKAFRGSIPLVVEPVYRALRFEIDFFGKSPLAYGARCA
jgi:hypothetical protein